MEDQTNPNGFEFSVGYDEAGPDLFTEEEPVVEGAFAEALEPAETVNRTSPKGVSRTAMMAALADSDKSAVQETPEDYMSVLLETKGLYEERITDIGDSQLRSERAAQERLSEVRDLIDLAQTATDEKLRIGAAQAAQDAAAQDMEHKAQFSLEKQTVDTLQEISLADPHVAAMYEDNIANPTTFDKRMEDATKRLMVQQMVDDMGSKERNLPEKVNEFIISEILTGWLEGHRATGNVEIDGKKSNGFLGAVKDFVLPGARQEAEAHELSTFTIPELAAFLPELRKTLEDKTVVFWDPSEPQAQRLLTELGIDTPTVFDKNLFQAIEIASVVPAAKIATVSKTMLRAGARAQTNNIISSAARLSDEVGLDAAAAKHGMDAEEVVEGLFHSALVNKIDDGIVSTATDATEALERGRKIYDDFLNPNGKARLKSDEQSTLEAAAQARVETQIPNRPLKDVKVEWGTFADGSTAPTDVAVIGKVKGEGGYANEASAKRVLTTYGLQGKTFQDASGQWFAEAKLPVREEAFYTPLEVNTKSFAGKWLRGGGIVSDDTLQGSAIQSGRFNDKTRKVFETISFRNISKLAKKDLKSLDEILIRAVDEEQPWLSEQQLRTQWRTQTGRALPPRVTAAYEDTRKIMDLEYYIRNQHELKTKSLQGFEQVEIGAGIGRGNAQVQRNPGAVPTDRVFDVTSGRHYVPDTRSGLTDTSWKALKDKGYILVKMQEAVEMADGTVIRSFIGKGPSFKMSELSPNQIPYKAGIHRMYRDKYFSKAASTRKQPDTGVVGLAAARAYRTFPSREHADEWNEVMNRAREVYNESPTDLAGLARVFDGRGEFPSPEEFVQSIVSKKVDPSEPFETVIDGALPSKYNQDHAMQRFFDESTSNSLETFGKTNGRAYHSERGERLRGFDGKAAPVLSVGETLNRAALSASKLNGFGDYAIESAERMFTSFQKYFDPNLTPALGSPHSIIKHATLRKGTPPEIVAQFEAQRSIIQRALSQPTKWDETVTGANLRIEEVLSQFGLPGVRVANYLNEAQPLNAIRGFAFHAKLGLFNVAQMPLQASSAFHAALAFPKYMKDGPSAFATGFVMRFAHHYGPTSAKLLDNPAFLKVMNFTHGKEEAKEMLTAFSQSGLLDVDTSHQLANSRVGQVTGKGRLGSAWEKSKKASGTFFFEPEKFNRSVAFTIAWREIRDEMGAPISRFDGPTMKQVMDKTETYAFQMASESAAAFQKGPVSVPTQFFSYPIRMQELMFTGNKLTKQQKLKLFGSQIVLYGSAGTVATNYASGKVKEHGTGQNPDKGSLGYVLDRGLIDTAVNAALGGETDVAVGDRIGIGSFQEDLWRGMINDSPYGDKSFVGVATGVSGQTAVETTKGLATLGKYLAATNGDFGDPLVKQSMRNLTKNISSMSNVQKGWLALKQGQLYSRKGTFIDDEVTTPEAFFLMMGIGNSTMNDTAAMMEYMSDSSQQVKDLAKQVSSLRIQGVNQPDKEDEFFGAINTLQHITDDDMLWAKVMKEVNKFGGNTDAMATTVRRRHEKQIAEETLAANVEKHLKEKGQ